MQQSDSPPPARKAPSREASARKASPPKLSGQAAPALPFTPLPPELAALIPELAESLAEGLVAVGGDLSVPSLLAAYSSGIFPWFSADEPILWWSPDPRFVLPLEGFHVPRSLARQRRRGGFELRCDTAFGEVLRRCSSVPRPGQEATWLVPSMLAAYEALAAAGYAHSFETWVDGRLVGGLYGVNLGAAFFGESMFSEVSGASKLALVGLVETLRAWNMELLDCQVSTSTLALFGAVEIPRAEFLRRLRQALRKPTRLGKWELVTAP